jgi:hypothetical protein
MALLYDKYVYQLQHPEKGFGALADWPSQDSIMRTIERQIARKDPALVAKFRDEFEQVKKDHDEAKAKFLKGREAVTTLYRSVEADFMRDAPYTEVVLADNVAQYYFQNKQGWTLGDFPVVSPPFHSTWFEFARPQGVEWNTGISRWAIWAIGDEVPLEGSWDDTSSAFQFCRDWKIEIEERPRWLLRCVLYVKMRDDDRCAGPLASYILALNSVGEIEGHDFTDYAVEKRHAGIDFRSLLHCALLTLSLMHCKNVTVSGEDQSASASRQWKKQHNKPLARYKILNIEPMKTVLRGEGAGSQGLPHAIHICRGHFRDYREHGLFGKYRGVYWWDSYVRGSSSEGVVHKEYSVQGPK